MTQEQTYTMTVEEELAEAPDCTACGAPAIDHEELAGACPGETGWYRQ